MSPRILILILVASLAVSGCAHKAKHFDTPDPKQLQASQHEAAQHVAAARQHVAKAAESLIRAKAAHGRAVTLHEAEGAQIAAAEATLAKPEFRNAPPSLLPLIEELKTEVFTWKAAHEKTATALAEVTPNLDTGEKEHAEAILELKKSDENLSQINTKYGPEYVAATNAMTDGRNTDQKEWAKDSSAKMKIITWYRLHFWLTWIVFGLGLVACGAWAFLKFTGRLAGSAAVVASRIP